MLELGFELLTDENLEKIKERINSDENPKNIKIDLALKIVSIFDGEEKAKNAFRN
jgi:tyrosyl-tRNA synthetase